MSHLTTLVERYAHDAVEEDRFVDIEELAGVLADTCSHFGVPPIAVTGCGDATPDQLTVLEAVLGIPSSDRLKLYHARRKDRAALSREEGADNDASPLKLQDVEHYLQKEHYLEDSRPARIRKSVTPAARPVSHAERHPSRGHSDAPRKHAERAGGTRTAKPPPPKPRSIQSPLPVYDDVPENGFPDMASMLAFAEKAEANHKGGVLFTLLSAKNVIGEIETAALAQEVSRKLQQDDPDADEFTAKKLGNKRNANGGKGATVTAAEAEAVMKVVEERSRLPISPEERAQCIGLLTLPYAKGANRYALKAANGGTGQSAMG